MPPRWDGRIISPNNKTLQFTQPNEGPGHDPIHDRPQFHSRLPPPHGVDVPLCRVASSIQSEIQCGAFLSHTKTFHDVYAVLATPAADPVLTFLVSYGHLLIGLSLLVGLLVRVRPHSAWRCC